MKLIRINPFTRHIDLIDTERMPGLQGKLRDKLATLQYLVTNGRGGLVELLSSGTDSLDLIGDEEALLQGERAFWRFRGANKAYCGTCLLVGVRDTEGGKEWQGLSFPDASAAKQALGAVISSVEWLDEPQALALMRRERNEFIAGLRGAGIEAISV